MLVVFNVDPSVTNNDIHQIFSDYGEIKEVCYALTLTTDYSIITRTIMS